MATAKAAGAPGLLDLAAITAGWFFGANPNGAPAYNPAAGTAIGGIETDGRINPNSDAESTIHALLTMLALDENPALKAKAMGISRTVATHGLSVVEAESGAITGSGTVVTPPSSWTGEANISGGSFVALNAGDSLKIPLPADETGAGPARNIYPIVNQGTAPSGTAAWTAGRGPLGSTNNGGAGLQGITDAPGILFPFALKRAMPAGTAAVVGTTDGSVAIDALLVQPLISRVEVAGSGGDSTLFVSSAATRTVQQISVPEGQVLVQCQYDSRGQLVRTGTHDAGERAGVVTVAAGGFTMVTLTRG